MLSDPLLLALLLALAVLLAFWRRRLPLELVALALVIAAALAGWLTPQQALAGFGNPATLAVVAMFVISAAVVRTGALEPIERWLAGFAGADLSQQLLLLAVVVGPLSAVLSNTAVVAMFIPVVERWCRRLGVSPSRLLMPLSFLTVLAGMGTALGTSTTLVASGLSEELGFGSFRLLQFTPMALVTYALGVLVLVLVAPRLLPSQPPLPLAEALESDDRSRDDLRELQVADASPLLACSLDASLLQHRFDVRVLALIQAGEWLSLPLGERRLQPGDVLVVQGRRQRLLALAEAQGLTLLPEVSINLRAGDAQTPVALAPEAQAPAGQAPAGQAPAGQAPEGQAPEIGRLDLAIAEVIVPAGSPLIGQSLRELRFAQRYNAMVLAIRRGEALLRDRLGQVELRLGDALLLQAPGAALKALQVSGDLLLAERAVAPTDRRDRLPWAVALTLAVMVLSFWRSDALAIWALLAVVGLVAFRVLTPQEVYGAIRWDVVVLLGSLLPLAQLLGRSGAEALLVEGLATRLAAWPPYGVLLGLYLVTALATELVSNQAAVTLMLPLGVAISQGVGVSAGAAMAVITFAASHSFLTPIGYQTNTMVYALGNYSFLDFLRLGLPLTLALSLVTPALALGLSL